MATPTESWFGLSLMEALGLRCRNKIFEAHQWTAPEIAYEGCVDKKEKLQWEIAEAVAAFAKYHIPITQGLCRLVSTRTVLWQLFGILLPQ